MMHHQALHGAFNFPLTCTTLARSSPCLTLIHLLHTIVFFSARSALQNVRHGMSLAAVRAAVTF